MKSTLWWAREIALAVLLVPPLALICCLGALATVLERAFGIHRKE